MDIETKVGNLNFTGALRARHILINGENQPLVAYKPDEFED